MQNTALLPVDALAPAPDGRYEDEAVVVIRRPGLRPSAGDAWLGGTAHFAVGREGGRLLLAHDLPEACVDDELGTLLTQEIFAPGWAVGSGTFERLFTGIVLTTHEDPVTAWEGYYRRSLARVEAADDGYSPIYRRAEEHLRAAGVRSVLDLGACFGFLALRLAGGSAGPVEVTAADISAGTCRLLDAVAERLDLPVRTLVCDAACVPRGDDAVDAVTVMHVLEHVDVLHGRRILAEAVRVARHRVVVAVPLEDEPEEAYGHVRTVSLADLRAEAAPYEAAGWTAEVSEFHGGWLVLTRS